MNEILYVDHLVVMSESMWNLKEKFLKLKETFQSKGLKVNLKKTKVLVSGSKGEVLKSKVDPCVKCSKRVMVNSMMCTKFDKWVHGRCAKMKKVTSTLAKDFVTSTVPKNDIVVSRNKKNCSKKILAFSCNFESAFSTFFNVKTKQWNCLEVEEDIRCALLSM